MCKLAIMCANKDFPGNFSMPNGSNCAYFMKHSWIYMGGVSITELLLQMCKWYVSSTLYGKYTGMAIKFV